MSRDAHLSMMDTSCGGSVPQVSSLWKTHLLLTWSPVLRCGNGTISLHWSCQGARFYELTMPGLSVTYNWDIIECGFNIFLPKSLFPQLSHHFVLLKQRMNWILKISSSDLPWIETMFQYHARTVRSFVSIVWVTTVWPPMDPNFRQWATCVLNFEDEEGGVSFEGLLRKEEARGTSKRARGWAKPVEIEHY